MAATVNAGARRSPRHATIRSGIMSYWEYQRRPTNGAASVPLP